MKRLISSAMRIFFLLICTVCFSPTVSFAQDLWTYIGETQTDPSEETIGPHIYQTFVLDEFWLENILSEAPMEFTIGAEVIMTLPTPTGGYESVRIEESPIFSPTLQAQYPEVRTYRAQGLDDPTATGRFDRTAARFHAMMIFESGTVYVDPAHDADPSHYISYWKKDVVVGGGLSSAVPPNSSQDRGYLSD